VIESRPPAFTNRAESGGCPNCKAEVPDHSQFCLHCGQLQRPGSKPIGQYKTPAWVAIPIILSVILILYLAVHIRQDSLAAIKPRSGLAGSLVQIARRPTLVTAPVVVDSALTVNARSFSWYAFTIPAGATTVSLNGHFAATGGTGNDIQVYVLDEDGFANFKNGHNARTFYNSGRATQSPIGAVLPNAPGNYYLVFDNRFSLLTPKAVAVNATLRYLVYE